MLRIKLCFFVISAVLLSGCSSPSSISTTVNCSGNMIVERSYSKKVNSRKREYLVKKSAKYQNKAKSEF